MKLKCYTLSISEFCSLYRRNKLELEPPYQRRPAWKTRQREDLLDGLAGQKIAQWEVFTKINSTGSRLTKNEIRHARQTPLFFIGTRLEKRWERRMVDTWRVFSKAEMDRYQYHEMMLEPCTNHLNAGISDRRLKLDEFMRLDDLRSARLKKAEGAVNRGKSGK